MPEGNTRAAGDLIKLLLKTASSGFWAAFAYLHWRGWGVFRGGPC